MEKEKDKECCECHHHKGCFGLLLFLIGAYFLAQELGYVSTSLPFWPVTFAVLGLGMFLKHLCYKMKK